MTAEQILKQGDLQACLETLKSALRQRPTDLISRISLFEVLVVTGAWEAARAQLSILGEMTADTDAMVQTYGQLLLCEAVRRDVFAGHRTPSVLGEPQPWIAEMVQALRSRNEGELETCMAYRQRALAAAPALAGIVNDESFAWIGDSDDRLGPIFEAMIDGQYFWVPFDRLSTLTLESPSDLRDVVWLPATFTWVNGGKAHGFVPTRYPDSEGRDDSGLQLGRKTIWQDEGGLSTALGQRVLATDQGDYPLMDIRTLAFKEACRSEAGETAHG